MNSLVIARLARLALLLRRCGACLGRLGLLLLPFPFPFFLVLHQPPGAGGRTRPGLPALAPGSFRFGGAPVDWVFEQGLSFRGSSGHGRFLRRGRGGCLRWRGGLLAALVLEPSGGPWAPRPDSPGVPGGGRPCCRVVTGHEAEETGEEAGLAIRLFLACGRSPRWRLGRGRFLRWRLGRGGFLRWRFGRWPGGQGDGLDGSRLASASRLAGLGPFLFAVLAGQIVAGLWLVPLLAANPLYAVVGRLQLGVRHHHDAHTVPLLDIGQVVALLVQQVGRDADGQKGADFGAHLLQGLFLHHADDRQRRRLDIADGAKAGASGTDHPAGLAQGRAQALARHLHQAKAGNPANLDSGAVQLQRRLHPLLHLPLVPGRGHVDEVNDNQPAYVAQAQLAADFVRRLQVGVERGLLYVGAAGCAGGVDVNGNQRLRRVYGDGAAGRQAHLPAKGGFYLPFYLVAVEEGHIVLVPLDAGAEVRHDLVHELHGLVIGFLGVYQDFADVVPQVVAQRADDDVAFLMHQERRLALARRLVDGLGQGHQVVEVPLQFFGAPFHPGSAHNGAHVLGDVQLRDDIAQLLPVLALYAPGDAAGPGVVGHEHQVAPRQADEGGERRALVAALLLFHLDQQLLALLDGIGDFHLALGSGRLLVVLLGDFPKRQEAVPGGAIVHKGGLKAGLHTGDPGLVDVALLLLSVLAFNVQVVKGLPVNQGDPQLLAVSCVDQHAFHRVPLCLGEACKAQTQRPLPQAASLGRAACIFREPLAGPPLLWPGGSRPWASAGVLVALTLRSALRG